MKTSCECCGKAMRSVTGAERCKACNKDAAADGAVLLAAYVDRLDVDKTEAKQQCTITDAVCALLMLADTRRFDIGSILRSAANHYEAETGKRIEGGR
jgi:hypothetical protein